MGLGKTSKRQTCRRKYKIAKLVRQHNKKLKKKAGKDSVNLKKKSRKDPGIPNKFPFKQEILQEAENRRVQKEEDRQKQVERRKKDRLKTVNKRRNLETLVTDAKKRADSFERQTGFVKDKTKDYTSGKSVENSAKAYYKEVKKVIEAADVIIEVLDARDPIGSRCPQVEEAVISQGINKKLILLLNKIDLVPKENIEKWLKYLRNEFPVVAFKASTQSQSDRLGHIKVPLALASDNLRKSSQCLGADVLMTLLGNYCRNRDIKTSITIGIVGFPNTGKSSIINSLKRCRACNVGATPGVTRTMQTVQLDKHIRLLDSPGIVVASNLADDAAVVLRNCVRVESLEDPVTPVNAIVARCHKQQLMTHYGLPDFSNVHDFLALLGKRRGMLRKGGVPDVNKAAKVVLQDWNMGKITYYTEPPENYSRSTHVSSEIVSQMSAAFDIEALMNAEKETLAGLKSAALTDVVLPSQGPTPGFESVDIGSEEGAMSEAEEEEDDQDDDDVEEMEDDDAESVKPKMKVDFGKTAVKTKSTVTTSGKGRATTSESSVPPGSLQLNRQRKKDFKKVKKQRKRADVVAGHLSSALTSGLSSFGSEKDEDYNFATDFK